METSTRSVSSSIDRASNGGCGLDMRATVTSAKNIIKGRMCVVDIVAKETCYCGIWSCSSSVTRW